jgi:hypothetical protein
MINLDKHKRYTMDDQQTKPHVSEPVMQPSKKKWGKKRKIIVIVLAAVALFVIAAGVLIYAGRLAVIIKEPYQKALLNVPVCGNDIVEKYNNASLPEPKISGEYAMDQETLNSLVAEIQNKAYYQQDATCQTILYWVALFDNNANGAKNAYDGVRNLYNMGLYADSNIRTTQPISLMEQAVGEMFSATSTEE